MAFIRMVPSFSGALFGVLATFAAHAQTTPESSNMRLVGYSPLQARTAYQPTIAHQDKRWIAYVGHHGDRKVNPLTGKLEDNGTSIVDVTDPANPAYLASGPRAIQTNNVDVDDRGYIYIVDRANTGMHILALTGPARDIGNWSAVPPVR